MQKMKNRKKQVPYFPLFFLLSLPVSSLLEAVSTPPPPPAGIVERQIELEYEADKVDPEKEIPLLEVDIPEKKFTDGKGTALVSQFIFEGNTVFSQAEMQKWVSSYQGKELSIKELNEICFSIQKRYIEEGFFLTRAYIPEQEIEEGKIRIVILEGILGKIQVVGNKHYKKRFVKKYFKKYQGKPINYDKFLKALLLLDENIDLDVGAVFKKGQEYGTADVVIRVKDQKPIHLTLDHNNYGSDYTVRQRSGAKFEWGNVLKDGDFLKVIEVLGAPFSSLNFTDVIYHYPVNTYGSSVELGYLCANFKTRNVGNGIRFTGRSHIGTGKYLQAIHRTRRLNTDVFMQFDYKQIQNIGNGQQTSYDKLRVLTGGFQLDYIDGWRGRNLLSTSLGWGIPDVLGGLHPVDSLSSRQGGGGRFIKWNVGLKRLQQLPLDCFILLNGVGQAGFDKLPLPEQIYIGGVDTVRGYKLAEGLGDFGFYANLEVRVPLPFLRGYTVPWMKKRWGEGLQFVGFMDHGQTFAIGQDKIRELVETPQGKKKKEAVEQHGRAILTSVGAGVRVYGPWKFEISFDAGYPLTDKFRSSTTITYFRVGWNIL